jgi:ABC-type proline/glycine betaine transport system ATPase subunit
LPSKRARDAPVRERAQELAHEVGIGDKVDRHANLLSQGEKQRVAVCRALLARPPLILADEPTGIVGAARRPAEAAERQSAPGGHDSPLADVRSDPPDGGSASQRR